MNKRHRRGIVVVVMVAAAALGPASALAGGPGTKGGGIADGQPDNDTQLSVLTEAEAAFVQRKLALAASLSASRTTKEATKGALTPTFECEVDPCEDSPPPPTWPEPSGPPTEKTLLTKARQQKNNYYCGPASGQVVINWSRGIISGNNDGEDPTTNWRTQTKIAQWMNTTTAGTGGANLAAGLNHQNAVLKPVPDWIYSYVETGSPERFHNLVVTDVAGFNMPLVLATVPHAANAGVNYLESWPRAAPGAHHWIVLRGYVGLWGSPSPVIKYQDSAGGYGGGTGAFADLSSVLWQVNDWNQGGHIVW